MFRNYFKIAFRNLLRQKGFSFINILGLALGLTACLLIGLFVFDELGYDKHIPGGERVFRVYNEIGVGEESNLTPRTPPMFAPTMEQELPEVEQATRIMEILSKNLFEAENKAIYEEGGFYIEPDFFEIFPLKFKHGSIKNGLIDPSSIVISEAMAEKFFGTQNPLGKEILIEKQPYQVSGVLENSNLKFHLKINYLLNLKAANIPEERLQVWYWNQFNTYLKVKEGTDVNLLLAKFQALADEAGNIDSPTGFSSKIYFQPLEEIYLYSSSFKIDSAKRGNITYVRGLTFTAIFILLIACFNFINLATAKSLQRAKEVGVRKSIGANRKNLIFQFLSETILLASISVLLSFFFAFLLLPFLNNFTQKSLSLNFLENPGLLLAPIALTVIVGVMAGFYPALVLSGFNPVKVLKGTIAGSLTPGRASWVRQSLVVVQFSLSIFLIISALIVFKQVDYLHNKDLGFNNEEIMFFPMRGEKMFSNHETFKSELTRLPEVSSVSMGYGFPGDIFAGDGIIVPGKGNGKRHSVTQLLVDHDYVKTLDIEIIAGRDFSRERPADQDHAFMINEEAVRQLGFETPENALGQKLEWNIWNESNPDSLKRGEVIGVVKDFHYKSLFDKVEPTVIQIFQPAFWKVAVKLKAANLPEAIGKVEDVWNNFSPEYPLEYSFMDESFEEMYRAEDKLKVLLWIFTGIAIFVGCMGLFGLAAYAAESRKKEIGIRKVLGAVTGNIVALISKDFLKLIVLSAVIAFPLAWLVMRNWLQDFAYKIDIPLWVFFVAGAVAALVAMVTISYQAIKAALADPVKNLRID